MRAVKLYMDGALGSRGAALKADYSDDPGNRGLLLTAPEELRRLVAKAKGCGVQVATHAIGDRGTRIVLDTYAQVLGKAGGGDRRWRVEHAQIVDVADIARFAELKLVASMQPTHATSDMPWAQQRLGSARLAGAYAWRRFAKAGYLAIAPELFVRQGDAGSYGEIAKLVAEVVSKVPDAQVMGDLDACVAWAKGQGADSSKVAVTGFCWGGRITWLYSAHNPKVKAGVAWYGKLVGDATPQTPKHPVDIAADLKAPVLGLYGGADQGIPFDTVEAMKAACAKAGKTCEIVVFDGAPHAFHADYRPSYRAEPAKEGWSRLLAWLKQHGVA